MTITPGGNPVCPRCGNWCGPGGHQDCDADLIHWWSPIGATHAVVNVMAWQGSDKPADVTCPICLEHIKDQA